jgi:hypothetical protein
MAVAAVGTEVYTTTNDEVIIVPPDKTDKFKPKKGMKKISGITNIVISLFPGEIIKADINFSCTLEEIKAIPTYFVIDPNTGNYEEVKSIEFKSGEKWEGSQT